MDVTPIIDESNIDVTPIISPVENVTYPIVDSVISFINYPLAFLHN